MQRGGNDVYFTKDGKLLLFHDDTLERTTNGHGLPEEYSLEELKRLDAGSWWDPANTDGGPELFWDRGYTGEQLITLEELLDEFGNAFTYHIEIKMPAPGLVPAVIQAINDRGLVDNVFIATANNDDALREAIRIQPEIRTASACVARLKQVGEKAIEECFEYGYSMVTLASHNQSKELVELG